MSKYKKIAGIVLLISVFLIVSLRENNFCYKNFSQQIEEGYFYNISNATTTVVGNPTDMHGFDPVHATNIVEVNKTVDGASRKYLAYDSDVEGTMIKLYYTDNLDGQWTPYSGNPILHDPSKRLYRTPTTAYHNGIFHMFLCNKYNHRIDRYTSSDGINYTFTETIFSFPESTVNSYIWLDPNDNKWHLYYTRTPTSGPKTIRLRQANSLEDLDTAQCEVVIIGDQSDYHPLGYPTIMYADGKYWYIGEALESLSSKWQCDAYWSTSDNSNFQECINSPIVSNDEACPRLVLDPSGAKAYLYISRREGGVWYQDTREINFSQPTPTPPPLEWIEIIEKSTTQTGFKVKFKINETSFTDLTFKYKEESGIPQEATCTKWGDEYSVEESVSAGNYEFIISIMVSGETKEYGDSFIIEAPPITTTPPLTTTPPPHTTPPITGRPTPPSEERDYTLYIFAIIILISVYIYLRGR